MTDGECLSPRRWPDFDPAAWIDQALRSGMAFGIDQEGQVWRWQAVPEADPGPSEAYRQLCEELDRYRPVIREEFRRRAEEQGRFLELGDMQDPDRVYGYVFLCGTSCFGRD